MKKRRIILGVCTAFIIAIIAGAIALYENDDRAEVIALYYENEALFAEIAASGNFADAESINGVKSIYEASWSPSVEFVCRAYGFSGNCSYYGISYVSTGNWQDVSHCMYKFQQSIVTNDDGTIYEYQEIDGDDYWYSMKLSGDYWYYEVRY